MKYRKLTVFTLILAITLLSIVPAMAQEESQPPPPCATTEVSGTVVLVDPITGVVTIELADGTQCTVTINMDDIDPEGMHPIVYLLGRYFHNPTPAELQEALTTVTGCAVDNGDGTWSWAECGSDGAVPVRVTGTNEDGTFIAVDENGVPIIGTLVIDDEADADQVRGALETLIVDWTLDENGSPSPMSDQIAAYHEEGMGFGVLVKLYAIAQESELCQAPDCSVDTLVQLFQSGELGMGQIFKEYGKPQKLGVGHVRQELTQDSAKGNDKVKDKDNGKDKGGDDQSGDESQSLPSAANKKNDKPPKDNNGLKGICNAISKNGKPKDGVTCP